MKYPKLSVKIISPVDLEVDLLNPTEEVIKVWRDSNSWGAARWRILIINKSGQLKVFYQNPNVGFTRNIPVFNTLNKKESIKHKLNLNTKNWLNENCETPIINHGDMVIIIYDVPRSDEALRMNVFYGVVSTAVSAP